MRHYMVDPVNDQRLLKIPPNIVAAIKAEAYMEAGEAVKKVEWFNSDGEMMNAIVATASAISAIEDLLEVSGAPVIKISDGRCRVIDRNDRQCIKKSQHFNRHSYIDKEQM